MKNFRPTNMVTNSGAVTIASMSHAYVNHDLLEGPNDRLMKAKGLPCCVKTTPIASSEASHSTMNGSLKLGNAKVGADVKACLRTSNAV